MAKVELKQPIVQAIADDIKDAQSVVIVDYRGLTVAQDTELRKQLREAGVIYKVCKNTMMKRAFEGTDFAGLEEYMVGPSAMVVSKSRCGRRNCLRCSRNHRTFQDSFERRAPFQIVWKLTVTYHKSCSCT